MTDEVVSWSRALPAIPSAGRVERAIGRQHAGGLVRMAAIDLEADVSSTKVEGLTAATITAMASVGRVARVQNQLELGTPEASGRLSFLADAHALAMEDVLRELRTDLRRR